LATISSDLCRFLPISNPLLGSKSYPSGRTTFQGADQLDDAHPKFFESLVIKLAGVVLSHPKNESFLNGQGNINV
jgi:hypothetical protein